MSKAAELKPELALKMLGEGRFGGMNRSSAVNGYVKGLGNDANWPKVIEDIKGAINRTDIKLTQADELVAQTIAIRWARKDLESSMDWYVHQSEQDLSNPRNTTKVASVLTSLPEGESYRAMEWIEAQRERPDWNDHVAISYGTAVALKSMPLTRDMNRLVGSILDENERYRLVHRFVAPVKTGGEPEIRYPRDQLNQLVDAANLSESDGANMRKVIRESKVAQ